MLYVTLGTKLGRWVGGTNGVVPLSPGWRRLGV